MFVREGHALTVARRLAWQMTIRGGLALSFGLAACGLMQQARGMGTILTLHRVRPAQADRFAPNAHLEVTPDFLDAALQRLKASGVSLVDLDEIAARHSEADRSPADRPPFVAVTLDDGYRDNLDHAAPIFARHGVPFTVFVVEGFARRQQSPWWETLAALLGSRTSLPDPFTKQAGAILDLSTRTAKQRAFDRLAAHIRGSTDEAAAILTLNRAAEREGLYPAALTERLMLDERGLIALARSPGANLGAHTVTHRALAPLDDAAAEAEIAASARFIADLTGQPARHFAFPYGDAPAVSPRDQALVLKHGMHGYTTRPGTITMASLPGGLPRVSVNGHYQRPWQLAALVTGIPFRLRGRASD
ncbi:hypothetical protein BTR14_21330 [Rhizobium rhizosphaerae]|uniref:Chitooligosaccharide deacetylase n=1 Tax=Xaviernesmea rhizosphaerae TaxID=1672749 RepID=A0ABX3P7K9_9HYPH|nr:hypothetical protein BTR14_21330 [Xaviernesmea rhizosphaerae]